MSYQNQNTQDPSPVEKVRQFLQGILSPAQLQQLDQILQGIDLNSGGSPAPVAMQLGGSEPGGKPAQDRRSVRARDAASGVGPTDSGPERPNYAPTSGPPLPLDRPAGADRRRMGRDSPPRFDGMPSTDGKGPAPYAKGYGGQLDGFGADAALEVQTLRARLRQAGMPLGNHQGTLPQLRQACHAYGVPTGMAMDDARGAASDINAPLDALSRIGSLSTMGRVTHDAPPPRVEAMAYDSDSGLNSVARYFPEVAANWLRNDVGHAFTVSNPAKARADDRMPRRRATASVPMAFDTTPAGRSGAPSISAVFGDAFKRRLDEIGTVSR